MKSRKVLTIDHCFQILLNRVNGLSWQDAIIQAIPARKGAQLKGSENEEEENDEGEEQEAGAEGDEGIVIENSNGAVIGRDGDCDEKHAEVPGGANPSDANKDTALQSETRVPQEERSSQIDI